MTSTRRWTLRVAMRALLGLAVLNRAYGPWFTGALAILLLLLVLAAVTRYGWLLGVAAVLSIAMSVWVFRAGVEGVSAEPQPKAPRKPDQQHWRDTMAYYRPAHPRRYIGLAVGRPHDGLATLRRYREQSDRASRERGDDVPGDR